MRIKYDNDMSKYGKLSNYLATSGTSPRCMSFNEIEEVLGFALPASARSYPAWWANDLSPGRHSNAWLSAGRETEAVDLGNGKVTFRRAGQGQPAAPQRPKPSHKLLARSFSPARVVGLPIAPDGEPARLSLEMQWRTLGPLGLDDRGAVLFPTAPKAPGIYRFRFIGTGGVRYYIGETAELHRRFQHYRNPGPTQATNIRLNGLLLEHFAAGDQAELDIIVGNILLMIGDALAEADLTDKATRRLLEHAAIVIQGSKAIESLNR